MFYVFVVRLKVFKIAVYISIGELIYCYYLF